MRKIKLNIKNFAIAVWTCASMLAAGCFTACSKSETYEGFVFPEQAESSLVALSNTNVETPIQFGDAGFKELCLAEYESDNGECRIKKMEHYYDITLDYENFSPSEVGKAYAATVLKAIPDFHKIVEPYLYENITGGFPAIIDDYEPVWERILYFLDTPGTMKDEYKEELIAFAREISGGAHGYKEDGYISYEEALTLNFIPEALRGTACSALSLWGSKTETGDPLTLRLLEWHLGTDFQMCKLHAVIHAEKGKHSFTGISFVGFQNIVSAINDDGVFAAILDVGCGEMYEYEGRKAYTYDMRWALEEFTTAKEVGNYVVKNSADYTWSNQFIITDKNNSYVAENAVLQQQEKGNAVSVLRDNKTPLLKNLKWDSPDSLCVVNSFATQGNQETMYVNHNAVRFAKYNEWVSSEAAFSVSELKAMISQEKVLQGQKKGEAAVDNVRQIYTSQMIIVDYHTGNIQVSFTPASGPDDNVIFTDVGYY